MDPKDKSNLDQGFAAMEELAEGFPVIWSIMFKRCLKEGFTEDHSLKLVQTYIMSQGINGTSIGRV